MKKVVKIIIVALMLVSIANNYMCFAADIWDVGADFINLGIEEADRSTTLPGDTVIGGSVNLTNDAKLRMQELLDFLWGLGLLTVFICTIVLGIKYMLVSPAEKSKIKQATTPYLIGVTIIFGAVSIWKLLIEILDGNL